MVGVTREMVIQPMETARSKLLIEVLIQRVSDGYGWKFVIGGK